MKTKKIIFLAGLAVASYFALSKFYGQPSSPPFTERVEATKASGKRPQQSLTQVENIHKKPTARPGNKHDHAVERSLGERKSTRSDRQVSGKPASINPDTATIIEIIKGNTRSEIDWVKYEIDTIKRLPMPAKLARVKRRFMTLKEAGYSVDDLSALWLIANDSFDLMGEPFPFGSTDSQGETRDESPPSRQHAREQAPGSDDNRQYGDATEPSYQVQTEPSYDDGPVDAGPMDYQPTETALPPPAHEGPESQHLDVWQQDESTPLPVDEAAEESGLAAELGGTDYTDGEYIEQGGDSDGGLATGEGDTPPAPEY